ncbi:MAG: ion transporter, partial [Pseudomonadota bacterium]
MTKVKAWAIRITEDARFRNAILGVILFNAVILGLETSKTTMAAIGPVLLTLDKICLAIFVVEIVLKLIAQSWGFFRKGWNIFDFIIVGISLAPA